MTTMTIAPATGDHADDNSYNTGYTDGELAALTRLPARRVHARANMAEQYDWLYAQGLIDGYLHAIQVNIARAEKAQARTQGRAA